ncbi:MAG TPA: MFS transporter [Acidimicrobiia bacterium]|nr:MFS transporter [Acidimicrobiia bacterium]
MSSARSIASTTFRSLRTRNYRLFFIGQGISLCGTWMQTIALGWLVLHLSDNSGVAIGAVIALQFVPTLLFGAWAGVVADRLDKRILLVVTAVVMACVATTLAVLTLAGVIQLWMVFALVLVQGFAQAFDNPTRLSFVSEMTGAEDLPNAVGLNSALFQVARIVGPAFAGVIIVLVGTGTCFALNAASFVAVIVALLLMDPALLHRSPPVARAKGQVREGLRYIRETPELRSILLITAVVGTLAINYPVVLPLIAKLTFHGNAETYSWMTVSMGLGALVGALVIAHRQNPTGRLVFLAGVGFGAAIVIASLAPTLALFVFFVAFVGAGQITFLATCQSTVQLEAEPSKRGRVMAVYSITILGSTPIGGPLVGWISQEFGARYGLLIGGVATLAVTFAFARTLLRSPRALDSGVASEDPALRGVLTQVR